MNGITLQALRERVARAIYEWPGHDDTWESLGEERREPWLADADRAIGVIAADASFILGEAWGWVNAKGPDDTATETALRTLIELRNNGQSPQGETR